MEFRILGPLEVWADGHPVRLTAAKQRAILAILLLAANRIVSAERLIELLWGEDAPETAASSLQVHISQLRKALEPDHRPGAPFQVLSTQAPGYLLRVRSEDLDLNRFKRLVDDARLARSHGEWMSVAKLLRSALDLWRGRALAGLDEQSVALAEQGPLDELRLQALEDRIEADLMVGAAAELVSELERLVLEHPFRERLSAQLMLALYRAGRQAEASQVFYRVSTKLVDEFGIEPGPELQELSRRMLRQDQDLLATTPNRPSMEPQKVSIPFPLTKIIGRDQAIARVKALLSEARLVTLTGAGGVGKSRLALEVANELVPSFPGGAWLIELAGIRDPILVDVALRSTLGIAGQGAVADMDLLCRYLENRHALLVVDNCEHLIEKIAASIADLLGRTRNLYVLTTSRELLRLPGERTFAVPPLDLPDPSEVEPLTDSSAVQLFCEQAAAALEGFSPSSEELSLIGRICGRLDGLPLAIRLAATRVRTHSIHQIASRLDDRFGLLSVGERTGPAHHQTLKAALDWSYSLLTPPEQLLLRRVTVFAGRAPLEAVEAVCGGDGINESEVADLLGALAGRSLLTVDRSTIEPSYQLLETVRAFGHELLRQSAELNTMRDRHLNFFLTVVAQLDAGLRGKSQAGWLRRTQEGLDDFRGALQWAETQDSQALARLSCGLAYFWLRWGYIHEGRRWLSLAVSRWTKRDALRGQCLSWAGIFAWRYGDREEARNLLRDGLSMHRGVGDSASEGWMLVCLGSVEIDDGAGPRGLKLISEGVETCRRAGNLWQLASALNNLGLNEYELGRSLDTCLRHLEESLELSRGTGDELLKAGVADSLAQVATARRDLERARALWGEALEVSVRLHETWNPSYCIEGFARIAVLEDRPEAGLILFAAAQSARIQGGFVRSPGERPEIDRYVGDARSALAESEAAEAWNVGLRMRIDDAISLALEPVLKRSPKHPVTK